MGISEKLFIDIHIRGASGKGWQVIYKYNCKLESDGDVWLYAFWKKVL